MNPESATPKKIDIIKKKDPVKMTRFFKHVAAPLKTGGSVPEESKVKPVAVALFHAEIKPVTDKQHVHWMLEKEKEYNSSNEGKHMTWCVVEQPMGKDLMIYTDGEMVQLWTPYHGFVDVSSTPFGDMKAIKDQLWAFYTKIKGVYTDTDQIVIHIVLYGSDLDPLSIFTNSTPRMTVVDLHMRQARPQDQGYSYKCLPHTILERFLTTKGAFQDRDKKPIEHLIFTCPKVLRVHDSLQEAIDKFGDLASGPIKSEFEKGAFVEGLVIKSVRDFHVHVAKTDAYRRVITKVRAKFNPIDDYTVAMYTSKPYALSVEEEEQEQEQAKTTESQVAPNGV
jgi:hypothetical protein